MKTTGYQLNNQGVDSKLNAFFKKYSLASLAYRCGMHKARGVQVSVSDDDLNISSFPKDSFDCPGEAWQEA